jgi:flagellar export protein FliJ
MPFRFPLETVLHLRRSLERQQELRLRAANQQVARLRHLMERIEQQSTNLRLQQCGELGSGTTAAELHFANACQATLAQQRIAAQTEFERLERRRDQQKGIYQRARRERETFESLREQQRIEFERGARRREQRDLDELFLLRRAHVGRG